MTVMISIGDQVIGAANPTVLCCLAFIIRGNAKFQRFANI